MTRISLVVCVHKERDLLERLFQGVEGCYDDLVVVHDGPEAVTAECAEQQVAPFDYATLLSDGSLLDGYRLSAGPGAPGSIQALVHARGGRYFEGARAFQQEPHWPFAWSRAKHDWILRLDADEFPSPELRAWIHEFRGRDESPLHSGYTCIWPFWDGCQAVSRSWPRGRSFLFHRQRVRFFGMAEQAPIPDTPFESVDAVLCHQPKRKSYGVHNAAVRPQGFRWRAVIAQSLMGKPTDLPHWRWKSEEWPIEWERLRKHPIKHSLRTLVRYPLRELREMIRVGDRPNISASLGPGLFHSLLGLRVFLEQRRRRKGRS